MNRRDFLFGTAAGLTYSSMLSNPVFSAVNNPEQNKSIKLYHIKTRERLNVTFWRNDWFDFDAFAEIEHFLRDWREDRTHPIDPQLIDIMYSVNQTAGGNREIAITSAFRTKKTNDWLRSHPKYSASKNSLHMHGRAIDFYIPGARLSRLNTAAQKLRSGGVGYYPKMSFVHVDTGPRRYWRG